jgi:hypothetical protein
MTAGALAFGRRFEVLGARIEHGLRLPVSGEIGRARQRLELDRSARRVYRVTGNEMVDEGIKAGDRLLVEPRDPVPDGATVLAELGGRLTVKRFFRDATGHVRLEPANRMMLPLVMRGDRVRVHGVVVGLLRRRGFTQDARAPLDASAADRRRRRPRVAPSDLTYRMLQQNLGEWVRISGEAGRISARRAGSLRIRELGRSLRALVATYATVSNPRLRLALLEEAARISREMRYLAAASGWPAHRIRPLLHGAHAAQVASSRRD